MGVCAVSGQGVHGPDAEKGDYDSISFWSRSGVASAVTPDDLPYPLPMPGGAFGDSMGASMLAGGIAAAIAQRAMTGQASVVDVSLLNAGMWVMHGQHAGPVRPAGAYRRPAPALGAHNLEVLLASGYSVDDIIALQISGAIF